MIHQLVYHSRYADTGGALASLQAILGAARANNACDGITGFLIFDRTSFVQLLEGSERAVLETYERVVRDHRHYGVTVMARRQVTRRDFPHAAMASIVRGPDTRDICLRHGVLDAMEARELRAIQVIAMAKDVLAAQQARQDGASLRA